MSKFNLSSIISGKMDSMDVPKLDTTKVQGIPVDDLLNNGENDIFTMLDEDMESLMESIRLNGVLEPPLVTPRGGKYRIVSGHRRTECVRRLHRESPEDERWKSVLCVVQTFSEPEFETLALIQANTEARSNRKDWIAPAAKAAFKALDALKEKGYEVNGRSRDVVAKQMGISSSELGRQLFIDKNLLPEVKKRFPMLSTQVAYELAKFDSSYQKNLVEQYPENLSCPQLGVVEEYKKAIVDGRDPMAHIRDLSERTAEFERQREQRELREKAEKKAKKKAFEAQKKREGKRIYCGYHGGWNFRSECKRGGECTTECCSHCDEHLFCDKACKCYADKRNDERKALAHRVRAAREAAGIDTPATEEKSGAFHSSASIAEMAERFGCTTDYLLGVTEEMKPAPVAAGIQWRELSEVDCPEIGEKIILLWFNGINWVSSITKWDDINEGCYLGSGEVCCWSPLPELPAIPKLAKRL